MRGTLARMQKMKKLRAQVRKELNSLKITAKAEDEILIHLLSELESLKMIMKAQDECFIQLLTDSMKKMLVENERPAHIQNEADSVRKMEEEGYYDPHSHNEEDLVRTMDEQQQPAHFKNEGDSVRTMDEQQQQPAHFTNEGDSVRNLGKKAEKQRLRFQQLEHIMPIKAEEDEDENVAHFQDQLNSVRTMEMEEEHPAHFQIKSDPLRNLAMRREDQRLRFQPFVDMMPVIMEEDQDEDGYDDHSRDDVDSVNIKTVRLPMILTEETVGQQQYMEAPVEMGRRRKNCIVASKSTVLMEKKVLSTRRWWVWRHPQISRQRMPRLCLRVARITGLVRVTSRCIRRWTIAR
jgi:hypothetical protein